MHQSSHFPVAAELLDLLRRSPDTYWTAHAAAAAIGVDAGTVSDALHLLDCAGLLERARGTTAFRYSGDNGP